MAVDTGRVTTRRSVHYENLDEFLADAERLVAGTTHTVGNWTAAQIFEHLARTMNGAIDGLPQGIPAPIRFVLRLFKRRFLTKPLKPGFRLSRKMAAALVPGDDVDTRQAFERLRDAVARFRRETKREPSPPFGQLTLEEWDQYQLRHAELHMSFIVPD